MKGLIQILFVLVASGRSFSQVAPVFYNLSTNNGLSYIGVTDICVDKNDNLWVGTGNGLNVFNGKTTEKYYAAEYPALETSNIKEVACDKNNRVWVLNADGHVAMFDEKRNLHKAILLENNIVIRLMNFLLTPEGEIFIRSENGIFQFVADY